MQIIFLSFLPLTVLHWQTETRATMWNDFLVHLSPCIAFSLSGFVCFIELKAFRVTIWNENEIILEPHKPIWILWRRRKKNKILSTYAH